MAIYLPDPFEGINKQLMTMLLQKQQREAQDEDLKLRKQALKVQQEERQFEIEEKQRKQAEEQGAQQFMAQQLLAPVLAQVANGVNVAAGAPANIPVPQATQAQQQYADFAKAADPMAALGATKMAFEQMKAEQAKREQLASLETALTRTKSFLDTTQQTQFRAAIEMARGGAPKEIWESILPLQMIELADAELKLKNARSAAEADSAAMDWLVKNKYVAPGGTIVGAAGMMKDEVSKIRADARARSLELEKIQIKGMETALEGVALGIAVDVGPDMKAIATRLQAQHPQLGAGQAIKAAASAVEGLKKMNAPATEAQGKAQLVYAPAKAAEVKINELAANGTAWTRKMDEALANWDMGALKQIPGIQTTHAIAQRAAARAKMSPAERQLFTSTVLLTAARLRPTSGAQLSESEIAMTRDEFIPIDTDDRASRLYKLEQLRSYMKTLANQAGAMDDSDPAVTAAQIRLRDAGKPLPPPRGEVRTSVTTWK